MRRRRVAIVYTHPLLGQGIASLLEAEPRMQVVTVEAAGLEAGEQLRKFQPQVVIVEHGGDGTPLGVDPIEMLDAQRRHRLILLSMSDPGMRFSRRDRLCRQDLATPDDLVKMVLEGRR